MRTDKAELKARLPSLTALLFLNDPASHPRDGSPRLDAHCFLAGDSAGGSGEAVRLW
jgi:hypothetical protein